MMRSRMKFKGSSKRAISIPSGNSLADAFAPALAQYKMAVEWDTWGHLAPKTGETYEGYILFAHAWNDDFIIDFDFKGLDGSPWLNDDMYEFIHSRAEEHQSQNIKKGLQGHEIFNRNELIGVYRFDGKYRKFKNGTCSFSGSITKINTEA